MRWDMRLLTKQFNSGFASTNPETRKGSLCEGERWAQVEWGDAGNIGRQDRRKHAKVARLRVTGARPFARMTTSLRDRPEELTKPPLETMAFPQKRSELSCRVQRRHRIFAVVGKIGGGFSV